jgi:transposase
MAAKKVELMDLRQLLSLKQQGISNRNCEEHTGLHRNTINHYVKLFRATGESYQRLLDLDDQALRDMFPPRSPVDQGRYSDLAQRFSYFEQELKKPGCTREQLWRQYILENPSGYSYSQFNEHFARWRNKLKGSGKLIHKAGDKLYVDYTGKNLYITDKQTGEQQSVEVFVALLPASHYTFVEASKSQQKEDFIQSVNHAMSYFGGAPKALVTDNLKSAVSKGSKYEPILNKSLKALGLHYNTTINPTRTYAPQDKALVEGAVRLIYQHIFYPLSNQVFFDLHSLNQAIKPLLKRFNELQMKLLQTSRVKQYLEIEKALLTPLPGSPYELQEFRKAKVQKMGYVYLHQNRNYYSVPFRYIGQQVEVQYDSNQVEIYYKQERIASHKLNYRPGAYTTNKEHLSSSHKFYQQWSPDFFLNQASQKGPHLKAYIEKILAQADYPEVAYKQCLGILHLDKNYVPERIENACRLAFGQTRHSYRIIKNMLANNIDLLNTHPQHDPLISKHENIRGAAIYN